MTVSAQGPFRPPHLRDHWPFLVIAAVLVPVLFAFVWQDSIASVGDDSISYIALARYFSSLGADPLVVPWIGYHTHFPPLFPAILALVGGDHNHWASHMVVAASAALALCLFYRLAAVRLESAVGGVVVAALFMACPTAWISIKGVLSESLFLALSLVALLYHDRLRQGPGSAAKFIVLGTLLALVCLTRTSGLVLLVAYGVTIAIDALRSRKLPPVKAVIPFVIAVLAIALWQVMRPQVEDDNYARTTSKLIQLWTTEPAQTLRFTADFMASGWIATFTADGAVAGFTRVTALVVGAVGVWGACRAAWQNRLEGWYVIGSLMLVFLWVFPETNMRRLLYPVVPLLLMLAAEVILAWCQQLRIPMRRLALASAAAIPLLISFPAMLLVVQKALDREPVIAGLPYRYSDITDYYTTLNVQQARALAARHAVVIAGLEALERVTPTGARVMWVRPEYVALLGNREGVPWYHGQDPKVLAGEARRLGAHYIVVANLYKTDLRAKTGDPVVLSHVAGYATPVLTLANPVTRSSDFILLRAQQAREGD